MRNPKSKSQKLRALQLVFIVFFTVSGGPYGLESLLRYAGSHATLLLLVITPILWDIPAILTVSELNSMMPVEGGYYRWVKHALGTRWGFYEGWWTWLYTFIDLAIYPVMFVQYGSFLFPWMNAYHVQVCLVFVWLAAIINILGIVQVGRTTIILSVASVGPFLVMLVVALMHHSLSPHLPEVSVRHLPYNTLGLALYTVMWNCLGWDNVTTYAGEVENPVKSYLFSVFAAFGLVMVIYFIAVLVAQQSGIDAKLLDEQRYPVLGVLIGGQWLGVLFSVGGMACAMGIYTAVLLSVSRIPKVMADDGLLPAGLHRLHPRFHTPYLSIIICSLVVSLMILLSFDELVVIDVIVYGAGLFLEYIALIRLRVTSPDTHRPFRIPVGTRTLCACLIIPVSVYVIALSGTLASDGKTFMVWFALIALATAELAWQIIRFIKFWKQRKAV